MHFIPKIVPKFSPFVYQNFLRSGAHKWGLKVYPKIQWQIFSGFLYQNFPPFGFPFIPVSNTLLVPGSDTLLSRFQYPFYPRFRYLFIPVSVPALSGQRRNKLENVQYKKRCVWLTRLQLHQDYTIDSDLKKQIILFVSSQDWHEFTSLWRQSKQRRQKHY